MTTRPPILRQCPSNLAAVAGRFPIVATIATRRDQTSVDSTRNATITSARLTARTTSTGQPRNPCRASVGLNSGLLSYDGPFRMCVCRPNAKGRERFQNVPLSTI
jgi:hypothetical protein